MSELQSKARQLGAARVAHMTGYPQDVVSRWFNGGVNQQVEDAFRKALG